MEYFLISTFHKIIIYGLFIVEKEENTIELAFYFDYTLSENQRVLCRKRMKCVLKQHYLKCKNISLKAD